MKLLPLALAFVATVSQAQSFEGVYSVGRTSFVARALSGPDRAAGLFSIVYAKGDATGTVASLAEDPEYEFVFEEHLGDRHLGTFYFTRAWKGRPLEGHYVRRGSKRSVPVAFVGEAPEPR